MLGFALFGAGRIGRVHAEAIARSDRARLACVYDVDAQAAATLAARHGVPVADSVEATLATAGADAALIASSTPTHLELMLAATAARRPILCEKPIDLDLAAVDRRRDQILGTGVPIQIGFQRRYDSGHAKLFRELRAGVVGKLQQVVVTRRSFLDAVIRGAFTVPSDGSLDFEAIAKRLASYGYEGWFVVETEQDPAPNPPLEMAKVGHRELTRVLAAAGYEVLR